MSTPVNLAPINPAALGQVRVRQPLVWRLQGWIGNYLPLLVMAVLAAGTTWLVRQTPNPDGPTTAIAPRHKPDYVMQGFELQRFDPKGQPQAWIKGHELRHYPDTDRVEIDQFSLQAVNADGQWLLIDAAQAEGPRDGTQMNLKGQVLVRRHPPGPDPNGTAPELTLRADTLTVQVNAKQLRTTGPATVEAARGQRMDVRGFDYDHTTGVLRFGGPSRTTLPARR
jgi:lipopolysaccharide export system protein LptC